MTSENPTLTNLFSAMIIPYTWTTSIRLKLVDRDQMVDTFFHLIEELKGSKVDIAELKCLNELGTYSYVPFMVGTIGHDENAPYVHDGDFIGTLPNATTVDTYIKSRLSDLYSLDIPTWFNGEGGWLYFQKNTLTGKKLCVCKEILYHEFEIENLAIESYDIENGQTGYKSVGGQVSFTSQETFASAVSVNNFLSRFTLIDTDNAKYYEAEITEIETSLDESGYLHCVGRFSFDVAESDFEDWTDVTLAEWEQVNNPTTSDIHDWTEITSDTREDIIFPPEHTDFEKYKLSLSFDSLRVDTPRTLNAEEYCEISFGGSATLVNEKVKLGNDLVKVYFQRNKIVAATDVEFTSEPKYYLEPLEMPSGNGASTLPSLLSSNEFKTNTHTDGITLRLQYSFVLDENIKLLKDWFNYGRYGTQYGTGGTYLITPNIIYNVGEYWSSWGNVELKLVLAKLVESIEIENTESDTLTLGITMQIQGDNN